MSEGVTTVALLDFRAEVHQVTDQPLASKVVLTYEYFVTGTTPDQALEEVLHS